MSSWCWPTTTGVPSLWGLIVESVHSCVEYDVLLWLDDDWWFAPDD
jgi:hypothetical protein